MAQIDLKNAVITVYNGVSTTKVKLGEGNMTWTEKQAMIYYKDRGILDTVRKGDQEPMDVSLESTWEFITGATGSVVYPITPIDIIKGVGLGVGPGSQTDPCEPYAVDLIITYTPPCAGYQKETITLEDFRWESIQFDPKGGKFSITGKCNHTAALVVRS